MESRNRLRRALDHREDALRASVPPDRQAALLALNRVWDRVPALAAAEPEFDLVTGRRLVDLGGYSALQLCLETAGGEEARGRSTEDALGSWAADFRRACAELDAARLVLLHSESGFMRLVDDGRGGFATWVATRVIPAQWRERADIDWWASWFSRRHAAEMDGLRCELGRVANDPRRAEALAHRLAGVHVTMMSYQLAYPPDATLGSVTIETYRAVLAHLIARALVLRSHGADAAPQSEAGLVAALSSSLAADPAVIANAVGAFVLDRENAAYHAAVPGVAAPPIIRIAPDQIVLSLHGLTTQPLFFLTRELRRRDPEAYHNSAYLREDVFRQDLYALFADKRFVTSSGRITLRREGGDVRTDIDAVVFDRKTGALGVFELKSHDPFARSAAELARQRDNVLYANRQVSGVLAWVNRYGGDALLTRVDPRTAKTFRVQKVFPFVLGRYLARFPDGPQPDTRAAWGSWPQVLRLTGGQPFGGKDTNPLASLFTRLAKDESPVPVPTDAPAKEIAIGNSRLTIYPSYAAFQAATAGARPD